MAAGAAIASLPEAPRRSVRVIAWAAEENGLLGAREHAKQVGADWPRYQIAAESDFGAGRIYALRSSTSPEAKPVIDAIGRVLAPLGIATEYGVGGPGPDVGPLVMLGVPWGQLAQDGTDYFDYHHTPDDTLDKIDPKALDQQVAAYAAFAYLQTERNTTLALGPQGPEPEQAVLRREAADPFRPPEARLAKRVEQVPTEVVEAQHAAGDGIAVDLLRLEVFDAPVLAQPCAHEGLLHRLEERHGEDQSPAGGQHARELAQRGPVVGHVLQHVETTDGVE
jgi:hypothetical protein